LTVLRQLIEERTTITAYCTVECGGKRDLPLGEMAEAYGLDFDLNHYTMAHKLRCHKCGTLGMTIRNHIVYKTGVKFDTKGKLIES
jgi:hypothetical protein